MDMKPRTMMYSGVILLVLVVLASGRVTGGVKEDVSHGAGSPKHGKQEHEVDGVHNVHFDHEAILGSYRLEQEFDDLPPEEAKKKLSLLVKKMDKNQDGFVTKDELTDWILMSFRMLDEEDAREEFEDADEDNDGKISWADYLQNHYGYDDEQMKDLEDNTDSAEQIKKSAAGEKIKFDAADVNKDGYLDKEEFVPFAHPYNYEHMHDIELGRVIVDHDKNKDGYLTFAEFAGDSSGDKEWEIVEKERFEEYDTNKDGLLDKKEIRPWVLEDTLEEAKEEADHLIQEADKDEDGKLSETEIVDAHQEFVGSQATDYGRHLHFIKRKDEL